MSWILKIFATFLVSSTLLSCSLGGGMQIGTHLKLCCPGNYSEYTEYALQTQNMPLFLRDYVASEFDLAMQEKGLTRNDQINDLQILLRYNHVNLTPDQQDIDPFARSGTSSAELNYIATLEIEMLETSTAKLVWAGSISRIHSVVPGEYMHEDRARPEFKQAFSKVLEGYPDR
ncbi:MAG: hypothetical protein AB8B95_04800 [Pseudohongiellaceae bacterium]